MAGDVHINHAAPAATQALKSPYGTAQSDKNFAAAVLKGWPKGGEQGTTTQPSGETAAAKPDVPLNFVLMRAYKLVGGPPADQASISKFLDRVDNKIADTVAVNNLHVWGRIGRRAIALIPPDHWQEGIFEHREKMLTWVGPLSQVKYTDLQFCKAEIDCHLPMPPETTGS